VIAFRIAVAALPQLLLLLLVGARLDLLGGFNPTDAGSGIVVALFFLAPLAAAALLVVEVMRRRIHVDQDGRTRSSRRVAVALVLLLEALAVNLLTLTQVRMHQCRSTLCRVRRRGVKSVRGSRGRFALGWSRQMR
jgi:hypothetical protein